MADVAAPPEFSARALLCLVRAAPGGGIHRAELEQRLGRPWAQIWPVASTLYRRRLIDFCGQWMIAVPPSATTTKLDPDPPAAAASVPAARPQLQLVPSVRKLADELAALDRARS